MEKPKIRKSNHFVADTYVDGNGRILNGTMIGVSNDCIISECSATYIQGDDGCKPESMSDESNSLKISLTDGGYFVIECNRWAFDDIEEFHRILKDFANRFTVVENHSKDQVSIQE